MPQPQPSAVIATTINEAADGLEARADADIIVYAGQITRSGSQEIERLCRAKQHKAMTRKRVLVPVSKLLWMGVDGEKKS